MDTISIEFIEKFRRLCPVNQDKVISCLDQALVPETPLQDSIAGSSPASNTGGVERL